MAKKKNNKVLDNVSPANSFYIRKNPDKLTSEELAEKTGENQIIVERLIEEEKIQVEKEQAAANISKKERRKRPDSPFSQVLGRHQRKGQYVATVMTGSAAEIADANRGKNSRKKDDTRFIHKPKD